MPAIRIQRLSGPEYPRILVLFALTAMPEKWRWIRHGKARNPLPMNRMHVL